MFIHLIVTRFPKSTYNVSFVKYYKVVEFQKSSMLLVLFFYEVISSPTPSPNQYASCSTWIHIRQQRSMLPYNWYDQFFKQLHIPCHVAHGFILDNRTLLIYNITTYYLTIDMISTSTNKTFHSMWHMDLY